MNRKQKTVLFMGNLAAVFLLVYGHSLSTEYTVTEGAAEAHTNYLRWLAPPAAIFAVTFFALRVLREREAPGGAETPD